MLDRSSIVGALLRGELSLLTTQFWINGVPRNWCYFLVDGIYPAWAIFCSTFTKPTEQAKKTFAAKQEAVRKDIECAFGIIVARFHVLKRPLRMWYLADITALVHCCVVLHNMVVETRQGGLDG